MISVLTLIGTRPEAIKLAPVVLRLQSRPDQFRLRVGVTAQHRALLDDVLSLFRIRPDFDFDLMRPNQSLNQLSAQVLSETDRLLKAEKPDWVIVQGDTTTAMAGALAAFHNGVRVGHVEAGLRTYNLHHPFPEEFNRHVVDLVSDRLFCPTGQARQNLLREGVPHQKILVTGNTGIDALLYAAQIPPTAGTEKWQTRAAGKRLILVTAHRRESFGAPLAAICCAIKKLAHRYQSDTHFVYPVHPNPQVAGPVRAALGNLQNVTLLDPLPYFSLVQLLKAATIVMTDSGGLQEEAPSLGKPVVVLRETTERPELISAGGGVLAGTDCDRIIAATSRLLDDQRAYDVMSRVRPLYGDGKAADRIVGGLMHQS